MNQSDHVTSLQAVSLNDNPYCDRYRPSSMNQYHATSLQAISLNDNRYCDRYRPCGTNPIDSNENSTACSKRVTYRGKAAGLSISYTYTLGGTDRAIIGRDHRRPVPPPRWNSLRLSALVYVWHIPCLPFLLVCVLLFTPQYNDTVFSCDIIILYNTILD
jgi:hypothetical protein